MYVWHLQDFETGASLCFGAEHLALEAAEKILGNRAVAASGDLSLLGPGDGTTRIKIERVRRDVAVELGLDVPPPGEGGGS